MSRRIRRAVTTGHGSIFTWARGRDVILFGAGLAGIAREAIIESGERPTLLLLFAAMVGLPAFLRTDEARKPEPPAPPTIPPVPPTPIPVQGADA